LNETHGRFLPSFHDTISHELISNQSKRRENETNAGKDENGYFGRRVQIEIRFVLRQKYFQHFDAVEEVQRGEYGGQ
jgi:hypothetical protein